jgi:hypothetical protein
MQVAGVAAASLSYVRPSSRTVLRTEVTVALAAASSSKPRTARLLYTSLRVGVLFVLAVVRPAKAAPEAALVEKT